MGRFAFRTGDNEAAVRWAERALADAQRAADLAAEDAAARREHSRRAGHESLGAALAVN
jgi:hypothetical protein